MLYLAGQFTRQVGRGARHPEDHHGDESDRQDAEQPAHHVLADGAQGAGGGVEYCRETGGHRKCAEHTQPYRSSDATTLARQRGPVDGGKQNAHHQPGFKPLAQADEQVGNRV
ncbi:Uncharacterised protein [Mycobacteroides abscessus subsp. abscessus]|nr:Uncharacterised protein [Mycobacteroides abscessus subsp. abscessus]